MTTKYNKILPIVSAVTLCAPVAMAAEDTDSVSPDNQVQLAYRIADRGDMLGGVEVLDFAKLMEVNYINDINNGTIAGYVSGFNGDSLWGQDGDNDGFLVLIDGVVRDMNNIISTEVENITFMKGAAATVLYGSRAAKGVIYITTKRGKNAPLSINVRANTGWHVAKSFPEYVGSAEYMALYNQACINDGKAPLYSQQDLYNYASGNNPYRYPNLNMYSSDYVGRTYNRTDVSAEISGGNERARFYTNINYFRHGDYLKFGEAKHNFTDRFSVRGNIDVDITDWISAYVNTSATFYGARSALSWTPDPDDKNEWEKNYYNYWQFAAGSWSRPNALAPLIPIGLVDPGAANTLGILGASNNIYNGCFLGASAFGSSVNEKKHIFANYLAAGYNKFTSRQFQFDTGINVDLGMVTKGLTFNTKFAVDYATSYDTSYNNSYGVYVPEWSQYNGIDQITSVNFEGKDEHSGVQNINNSSSRQTMYWSGQFDYVRSFNDVHNLHALVVGAGWQRTRAGQYHKTSSVNIGFEADYNYDHRYYVDLAVTGVHSSKLAPGHRQGWSPTATIGWNIANEAFLADNDAVNTLMLSASAGLLNQDQDITDYYMYSANYTEGGWFEWAIGGDKAAYPKRGPNDDLTFVKRKEFTVGLRGELFNRLIDFNAMYFHYKTTGLIGSTSTKFPSYFSTYYPEASFVPYTNMNDNQRNGFDFAVNVKKDLGDFGFKVGVTGTYYDTKALKRDEVWENTYQYREGKPIDAMWGYRAEGFFQTDEEAASVDQSALGGGTLRAGDIKYRDLNGDGKIDTNDQEYLGKSGSFGSPFFMGVNLQLSWKGFTLFVHGLGRFGGHDMLNNNSYYRMVGENKYSVEARNAWTPETAATATLPRLTTDNGANNYVASDFWMYSTNRFDIDKIQLTYDFPKKLFHGPIVKALQLYFSADDLVTFGKNREILERNVGSAPQSRFYNVGAQVTF
ncbi:MAG: SusC/RagA family TonB-linked outer membrane protein [Muribaculaceae bacterium]|nr:SusC/RagA family TonB-linked outer membrane protein [Muribaculaceae bacterium]